MIGWEREDILEVLGWCEADRNAINSITTETEFILISELLRRCAQEIRELRDDNERLRNASRQKAKKMHRVPKNIRKPGIV